MLRSNDFGLHFFVFFHLLINQNFVNAKRRLVNENLNGPGKIVLTLILTKNF